MKRKIRTFESTSDIDRAIKAERKHLENTVPPGVRVTDSAATRSLLIKASTVKANAAA